MNLTIKLLFSTIACFVFPAALSAQVITYTGPAGSGKFGARVIALANGNYVVTDHEFDNGTVTDAGAVYLYNGQTHSLISTLKGSSASDHVGTYVWPLSNGNFVVGSPDWDNGSANDAGAATWVNGLTGLNGVVSSGNSLVGSSAADRIGDATLVLPDGNILLLNPQWDSGSATDAGAAAWMNGLTGLVGNISASNSLIGTSKNDKVGIAVQLLSNGNYVTCSYWWNNGSIPAAGAVTWCDGKTGLTGAVSSSNSLIGSSANDRVGNKGIVELTNGNYVVISDMFSIGSITGAGAVTWCNGSSGLTGTVSSTNSMIGTNAADQLGSFRVLALTNGNYVILSPNWQNGSILYAGAVTWCNGTTGGKGVVSTSNSFVGSGNAEALGYASIALANGNYVILSSRWKNGNASYAGAATWCDGSVGRIGNVSAANSLVGSTTGDGNFMRCLPLPNGNYIVRFPSWTNGADSSAGAVTWCDGTTGRTGAISAGNSLVGTKLNDRVGTDCAVLANGNYVVLSPEWTNNAGAVTWCDGSIGRTGAVGLSNSLLGGSAGDQVGEQFLVLTNGNYVALTPRWSNGSATNAGAFTWCSGIATTSAVVDSTNSIIGTGQYGQVGSYGIALPNGNYVIGSRNTGDVGQSWVGAVTWLHGSKATSGTLNSSNSLVGRSNLDQVGGPYLAPNDNYVVGSHWNGGALTFGSGASGVVGFPDSCNSIFGSPMYQLFAFNPVFNYLIVGFAYNNRVCIMSASPQSIALSNGIASRTFTSTNTQPFIDTNDKLICMVRPTTPIAGSGTITAKVFLATGTPTYNGQNYVRRHYDLSAATIPDTGDATTTLYFTQADFDHYNANNGGGPGLPSSPVDLPGIANLKVTLHRGTSSTGAPDSYSGWSGSGSAIFSIDPVDADIVWNACESRWEVTFDMTGYGGLFVLASSQNNALSAQATILNESGLSIAPIPARAQVRVRCDDRSLIDQPAAIMDIYGRTIREFRMEKDQQIDVRQLAPGTYYLRAGNGGNYKFIKL